MIWCTIFCILELDYIIPFILNKLMRLNFLTLCLILFSSLSFGQPTTWNSSVSYSTGDLVVSELLLTLLFKMYLLISSHLTPHIGEIWQQLPLLWCAYRASARFINWQYLSIFAYCPDQNSSSSSSIKIFSFDKSLLWS